MTNYCKSIFPWLERCETIFKDLADNSNDYGTKDFFLAEEVFTGSINILM